MVLALFEHIENPEHVAKLNARIRELEAEVTDYRVQNMELESRFQKYQIV